MQGRLGGNREAFLFRWTRSSDTAKWAFFLQQKDGLECISLADKKPSNADMETMVFSVSANKSPLAAGARLFGRLTKGLRGEKK